ncbi:Uncharacterized protein APZ42_014219 [Daphnia magna]|uniref:Uncharacterized protein n=1 Tax=Daphnia magna TaxID=35525 RepID=A0A162Q1Y1_9CRUS|nr:Uncharacterized protein APZ42_014219 [Daphnia magna]
MTEPLVCIGSHSSRFCHYLVKTRGSHQYSQLDVWDGKKVWKGNIGEGLL